MDLVTLKHQCCCHCCCCCYSSSSSSFIFFHNFFSSLIISFIHIRHFKIFTHMMCIVSISRSIIYDAYFKGHKKYLHNSAWLLRCTPLENIKIFMSSMHNHYDPTMYLKNHIIWTMLEIYPHHSLASLIGLTSISIHHPCLQMRTLQKKKKKVHALVLDFQLCKCWTFSKLIFFFLSFFV